MFNDCFCLRVRACVFQQKNYISFSFKFGTIVRTYYKYALLQFYNNKYIEYRCNQIFRFRLFCVCVFLVISHNGNCKFALNVFPERNFEVITSTRTQLKSSCYLCHRCNMLSMPYQHCSTIPKIMRSCY